jgi:dTDP-glucose 4,6-dehydratase
MNYQKNILITGGMGFIGSNYLNKFVTVYPNYLFINIDCLNYAANKNNVKISSHSNYVFEKVDIRNKTALEKVFKKYKITDVIHFAAESHVDKSIENPNIFVETNIAGTHNLLTLARKYTIKRFHQISTDEVYGSLGLHQKPFTHTSPLAPNNPYSASKASADMLVRSYGKTFNLDVLISRCGNNYGPNQDKTKLIPKSILNSLKNKKIPIYAKGDNIRDWVYVEDHIDAIDMIFHKGKPGSIYNIGGNGEISNLEIVKKILTMLGKTTTLLEFVVDRKGHDFRYAMDRKQLLKEFKWKPKVSLEEGLKKTIESFKSTSK